MRTAFHPQDGDFVNTRISEPPRSRHALIAEALAGQIQKGEIKIGDMLPSEAELSAAFGVSRHTVRIALRTLHSLGLVTSQQGIGTQVKRNQLSARYTQAFTSVSDLLQYATSTRVRVIDQTEIVADQEQAEFLQCRPKEHWWRIQILRYAGTKQPAIYYSEVFIPYAFGAVLQHIGKTKQPIFAMIEQHYNEPIVDIRQEFCAVNMTAEEASLLGVPEQTASLQITRRYLGRNGRVMEVARSIHPPRTFKYSMDIQLQHSA